MKIMKTNVQRLERGNDPWYKGWALDYHTLSSTPMPDGSFDTKRSELGEALYLLKYQNDRRQIEPLSTTVSTFLLSDENHWWFKYVCAIIPVPPSHTDRPFQPVLELARSLSVKSRVNCEEDYLLKIRKTEQLKNLDDPQTRSHLLENAFSVKDNRYEDGTVLVFDDLYRSGETLASICRTIKEKGHASYIYVLTITRTRARR